MTMIDVDTSPLEAAREWRGIGLVAAAMHAGLPATQAEALEAGDPSAFGSIDEMIAAAVVYGSSIGIGRDEAVALLDRTVCGTGPRVELPSTDGALRPGAAFSGAVQERSARMADRGAEASPPIEAGDANPESWSELEAHPVLDPIVETPSMAMPAVPTGPTPEQAVAASGEILLDDAFGPEAPWERVGHTGELEAWAGDFGDLDGDVAVARRGGDGIGSRMGATMHAAMERVVGTDRADSVADWFVGTSERIGQTARDGRERMRRSEHATLFVAIGGGAVLIALVVAIGGALGSDDQAGLGPAKRDTASSEPSATAAATKAAAAAKVEAAKPAAIIPPARLTLDIFNAGGTSGYAREVAAKLDAAGYKIGEVTNTKSEYASATIIHPQDMTREARQLARKAGITTLQVAPGSTRRITVIVK